MFAYLKTLIADIKATFYSRVDEMLDHDYNDLAAEMVLTELERDENAMRKLESGEWTIVIHNDEADPENNALTPWRAPKLWSDFVWSLAVVKCGSVYAVSQGMADHIVRGSADMDDLIEGGIAHWLGDYHIVKDSINVECGVLLDVLIGQEHVTSSIADYVHRVRIHHLSY